jgi:hypothetical protein
MTQGRRTAGYVSAAHAMLGFALLLGGARIGASLGWWQIDRLGTIAAHFHLAAFGFAGLTAVGVGGRMLPMFLVSGPGPEWPMRTIGPLGFTGLLILATGLLFGVPWAIWLGAVGGLSAAALFIWMVRRYLSRRLVPRLEPAFGHVIVGFASLLLALAAGVIQLFLPDFSGRGWVVYAELTLLGWLVIFITGILYRLFAFLIWLHIYARLGSARVAAELVERRVAWLALALMAVGIGGLVTGTTTGSVLVVRGGAVAFLGGSALVAAQYPRMFSGRPGAA